MKRFLLVILVLVMLTLLAACSGLKADSPVGIWMTEEPDSVEQAEALLVNVDAYQEEMALADLGSLKYAKVAEFREDGTYLFRIDTDGTKACVRSFFDDYFNDLYEGRTTLNEVYEMTFDEMTREEFLQFYAELYEKENYQVLLDDISNGAYKYESLSIPVEGTFKVKGDLICCTENGESEASNIKMQLSGENKDCLTLIYSDGTEVYTRVG